MGELLNAISDDYRRRSRESTEPVTDAKILSFMQQKCDEMFNRKKTSSDGLEAPVVSFRLEIPEGYISSVIRAAQNPVFSSTYYIVQEGNRQSNGSYLISVRQVGI